MRKALALLAIAGWLIPGIAVHAGEQKKEEPTVYTNEDLPPAQGAAGASPAAPPQDSRSTSPEMPSYDAIRDRNGHGEGWWRQRVCDLDARVLLAQVEAQRLHVAYLKTKAIVDPTLPARSREATLQLRELEAEKDGLPEELRQAGGLPGWLRGGGPCLESEPLPAPEAEAPTHAQALSLSWKPVPGGVFYVVELQCLDCCGMIGACEVRSLEVTGTSTQVPFEAGRSGRWRVRALDGAGAGGQWSDWLDFEPAPRD